MFRMNLAGRASIMVTSNMEGGYASCRCLTRAILLILSSSLHQLLELSYGIALVGARLLSSSQGFLALSLCDCAL
jgi:hypothetical protein